MIEAPAIEADQDVAGDVAADRPVDLVADSTPARLRLLGEERVPALDPVAPLEQHEERQEDDRHRRRDDRDDALGDRERRAGKPEHLLRAAVLHLLLDLLDDVVLALEEAEPSAPVRQVVDVVRERLDEAVDLVDQLRDERRADRGDHDDRDHVGERDRGPSLEAPATFDPADERIKREREEQRDHDPREHMPSDPDHLERDRDRNRDQQDPQDRAGTQVDHALRRHLTSITPWSDVVTVRT